MCVEGEPRTQVQKKVTRRLIVNMLNANRGIHNRKVLYIMKRLYKKR